MHYYAYIYFLKYLIINPMTIIVGVWVTNHPLRIYLVSVMVGSPLWDMGKSLIDTHETRYMHKVIMCNHLLEP